jgi:hypothetical protein
VTRAARPSASKVPIEFSKVGPATNCQLALGAGTPALRASARIAQLTGAEAAARMMRRSRPPSGFRNGEQTTW